MAFANPHASVEAPALPVPYASPALPSNTLAAFAPVTRPPRRPAPRAELAAELETAAALGGSAAVVLAALWSWANVGGVAWPCAESIARRAGKSRRTVFRALAQLEGAGLVVRQVPPLRARRRHRESNTYQLAPVTLPPRPAESLRPPRRVAPPRPSSARAPAPSLPAESPRPARAPLPAPSLPAELVPAPALPSSPEAPPALPPAPAATGPAGRPNQVTPWHPKGPGENQNQNARGGAQAREATAPPGDRLGSPAATPSSPEAPPAKRLTRAERAARNRAAWAARPRPAPSWARVPPPRRAPAPRAPGYLVPPPDPAPALAALRAWRESLPTLGGEPEPASAPLAPVLVAPRSEVGRWPPLALGALLAPFARVAPPPHAGPHERSPRVGAGPASATRNPALGAAAPSGPRVESRPPSLWSPHPRR